MKEVLHTWKYDSDKRSVVQDPGKLRLNTAEITVITL